MLPSEAKKLKACLYSIHLELLRIRALIKKKTKSDYASQERQEKENRRQRQEDIEKVTRALYDLKPNEEEKKEARSQYNKSLSIQFLLMIGTFLAFFAAVYYANIARKQACIMNLTLAEIKKQTGSIKDSADAAKVSADAAKLASETTASQFTLDKQQILNEKAATIEIAPPFFDNNNGGRLSINASNSSQTSIVGTRYEISVERYRISARQRTEALGERHGNLAPIGGRYPARVIDFSIFRPAGDINSQTETIEIKGYVKFDNGFGDWHTTQFCWRYLNGYSIPNRPMAPGGFVRCDQFLSEMNRIKTEIAAASRDAQKR